MPVDSFTLTPPEPPDPSDRVFMIMVYGAGVIANTNIAFADTPIQTSAGRLQAQLFTPLGSEIGSSDIVWTFNTPTDCAVLYAEFAGVDTFSPPTLATAAGALQIVAPGAPGADPFDFELITTFLFIANPTAIITQPVNLVLKTGLGLAIIDSDSATDGSPSSDRPYTYYPAADAVAGQLIVASMTALPTLVTNLLTSTM